MKVLHVNVRLVEGGAARIALDLHRKLIRDGIESRFAYGWGRNGGKSSFESRIPYSFQVGQQVQVACNFLSHNILGKDCMPPVHSAKNRFLESIQWADVIHLHAIHSYYLPLGWLIEKIIMFRKPVVWTAHDFWILTGRCASPEGCEYWRTGCGRCPTQNNYPPSLIDFSKSQYTYRRSALEKLGSSLYLVAPSEFVAESLLMGLPDIEVRVINNWIDGDFESAIRKLTLCSANFGGLPEKTKIIIVANDLSDPTKVDRDLINSILNISSVEIHTIGHNSPFSAPNVFNHGLITNRNLMVDIINSSDVALFSSEKDTFGLVIIEALACGVPVLAIESRAAKEVLRAIGINPISDKKQMVDLLRKRMLPVCYSVFSQTKLRSSIIERFGQGTAISKYLNAYDCAIAHK